MNHVTQKRESSMLDGTPDKRLFWSIISDYDIQTALCELIDNALDLWRATSPRDALIIDITLDPDRQLICVKDNAGGVSKENLRVLIAPGSSSNSPDSETIGIFGVGSKRAVVALAENTIIKTHKKGDKTYQIDVTKDWLESPDWEIPAYEIPDIQEGVTSIDLSALRKTFSASDVELFKQHLGETYKWFLQMETCSISLNGESVKPIDFENWTFPPGYSPQQVTSEVELPGLGKVAVAITAGLISDRDPVLDNYGVYFYCNQRLIVKELKAREVGYFVASEAGVPHPDASLCRVIVRLNGKAKLMPWNSSKTGINFSHPLFQAIRPCLIQLVSHFSSLSRRLKNDWEEAVFKFTQGQVQIISGALVPQGKRLILPPLPKVNTPHVEALKAKNETKIANQPWTLGLVESVAAVTILFRQKLETKNRIALILLDSNFEIALKEFIVHRDDLFPPKEYTDSKIKQLFAYRPDVISEVSKKVTIPATLLVKVKHYYSLRNKLIHERATVEITNTDVANYSGTIREILKILFDLDL
ncbi:ATP-binding protein [Candidatus Manganitrophus noduliformans]|uniref:Histidine kinase n=1 Tax=Candidatus Manganitrophus noduliformans TaxID=2606439 RepID=A0A7X6DMJ4_9BACT|nr:ATP-binding protein [Candidatus Manganitrophus noduliformans]NKE69829.1 histidine kinase [Candidatus Manganitrophus noduliformans]